MKRPGLVMMGAVAAVVGFYSVQAIASEPADFVPRQVAALPAVELVPRQQHSAVWTGTEMIVWGGATTTGSRRSLKDGAAYNPATRAWRPLPAAPIAARSFHAATWTGKEMVVWGGTSRPSKTGIRGLRDGAAYDPAKRTWRRIAPAPAWSERLGAKAVSAGGHVVIGGGDAIRHRPGESEPERILFAYDLAKDTWQEIEVAHPVVDLTAANERVIATGVRRLDDPYTADIVLTSLDPVEYDHRYFGKISVSGGFDTLGTAFDGTRAWVLAGGDVYSSSQGPGVAKLVAETDGALQGPIRVDMAAWSGPDSLIWTGDGLLTRGHSAIGRYLVAQDRVEVDRNNTDRRCGGESAVWTGSSLLVWGGTSCGPNTSIGNQITP